MKYPLLATFAMCAACSASAQAPQDFDGVKDALRKQVIATTASTDIVTARGFNMFLQKKMANYLSGSSDISLYKAFATYTSESDKLSFGFNIPSEGKSGKIRHLFNPLIETNIKSNFATLYKKSKWQTDIRLGFKYTWFPSSWNTINYFPNGTNSKHKQQENMLRKRSIAAKELAEKIDKEKAALAVIDLQVKADTTEAIRALHQEFAAPQTTEERKKEIALIIERLREMKGSDAPIDYAEKLEEYENELAKAEVEVLEGRRAYTWLKASWLSLWGFAPITSRSYYVAADNTQVFGEKKFQTWEFNAQGNLLLESTKYGLVYATLGYKAFQNNSALADLMQSVDYDQYLQMPGANQLNLAKLETGKAFIGKYETFATHTVSAVIVYMLPLTGFVNFGISIKGDQNFGDYSATHLRLGMPFRFKGKEKPINIEPQLRFGDITNYSGKADYRMEPTFGLNIGVPFTPLFK